MNKYILPIILGIFLLFSVSAMYAGESKNYSLSELGLTSITNVSINNSNITYYFTNETILITIPSDVAPQDFILTIEGFKEDVPVIVTQSSGGGGRSKKKVITNTTNESLNFSVEEWNYIPPVEEPIVIVPEVKPVEPIINQTTDKEVKKMDMNTWKWIIIGVIIFLILIVAILVISSKRNKKMKTEVYTESEMNKEIEDITKKIDELPK